MNSPIAQHIGGNEILKEELDAQQQYPNAIAFKFFFNARRRHLKLEISTFKPTHFKSQSQVSKSGMQNLHNVEHSTGIRQAFRSSSITNYDIM